MAATSHRKERAVSSVRKRKTRVNTPAVVCVSANYYD